MRLDQEALFLAQRARLQQHRVRDPDLADVVEEGAELEPLQRVAVETELAADAHRHVGDPARVRRRVLVSRLERVRERLDRGEECALEAREAGRVRDRELRLVCETAEQLQLAVAVLGLGAEGDRDRAPASLEGERRDDVRARALGRWVAERRVLLGGDHVGAGSAEIRLHHLCARSGDRQPVRRARSRALPGRRRRRRSTPEARARHGARPSAAARPRRSARAPARALRRRRGRGRTRAAPWRSRPRVAAPRRAWRSRPRRPCGRRAPRAVAGRRCRTDSDRASRRRSRRSRGRRSASARR